MESQSPGPPIFQVRNAVSTSSIYPIVVPEPSAMNFTSHQPDAYPNYRRGIAKLLGIVQLTSGVVCMLLNIGMAFVNYNKTWQIAAGWWASPFMIFAGSFALSSSKVVNKLTVHTTLWLSLVSSFLTIAVIVQGTMSLLFGKVCDMNCYVDAGKEIAHYILASLFMIFGIMEFCASICQFVIGCQAVCVPRPPLPYDCEFSGPFGYTNSAFPPPPPPYDAEPNPAAASYPSPPSDVASGVVDPYLPSYEESVNKT